MINNNNFFSFHHSLHLPDSRTDGIVGEWEKTVLDGCEASCFSSELESGKTDDSLPSETVQGDLCIISVTISISISISISIVLFHSHPNKHTFHDAEKLEEKIITEKNSNNIVISQIH